MPPRNNRNAENARTTSQKAKATAEDARAAAAGYANQAADAAKSAADSARTAAADPSREFTVHVPVGKIASTAADVTRVPIEMARQMLPAKGGLPMYAGIGALAVIGIIDWPVAAAAGAGYALARLTDRGSQGTRPLPG